MTAENAITAEWFDRLTLWLAVYCLGYIAVTFAMQEPTLRVIAHTLPPQMATNGGRLAYRDGVVWLSVAGAVVSALARVLCVSGVVWASISILAPGRMSSDGFRRVVFVVTVASFILLVRDGLNAVLLYQRGLAELTAFRQLFTLFAFDQLVSPHLSFAAFRVAVAVDPFFLCYLGGLATLLKERLGASWATSIVTTGILAISSLMVLFWLASLQSPPGG